MFLIAPHLTMIRLCLKQTFYSFPQLEGVWTLTVFAGFDRERIYLFDTSKVFFQTLAVILATGGVFLIAQDHEFAADLDGVFLVLLSCAVDSIYKVSIFHILPKCQFSAIPTLSSDH